MDYARRKTGIHRRCPLWPETVEAMHDALEARPQPKNAVDADLVFVGGFAHAPNADAVAWMAREILPRVRAALPAVLLHVVGAEPPK